jgi:hypothetical protein
MLEDFYFLFSAFKGIFKKPCFLLAGALLFDKKIRQRAQQAKI